MMNSRKRERKQMKEEEALNTKDHCFNPLVPPVRAKGDNRLFV